MPSFLIPVHAELTTQEAGTCWASLVLRSFNFWNLTCVRSILSGALESLIRSGLLRSCRVSQKDDVDATVLGSAVFGGVVGDGMKLGIACCGEIGWVDWAVFEEKTCDGGGSRGGELPVAGELRGVDGYVVGVAFDAEGACGQGGCEDGDHGHRCCANLG